MAIYRKINELEKNLILFLLQNSSFYDQYYSQLESCSVREYDETKSLEIHVDNHKKASSCGISVLTKGYTILDDGHKMFLILHQRNGLLSELEILRDDFLEPGIIPYGSKIEIER